MRSGAIILVVSALLAVPEPSMALSPAALVVSDSQLQAYARALVEVDRMRESLSERSQALLPADRALLQSQQRQHIDQILLRNDLSRDRFNAISSLVDQRPVLRREVHQFAMEAMVGT